MGDCCSEEGLELEELKTSRENPLSLTSVHANDSLPLTSQPLISTSSPCSLVAHNSHHCRSHHHSKHHLAHQNLRGPLSSLQPLQMSVSANSIRDWGMRRGVSPDENSLDCVTCIRAPCLSQHSLDLDLHSQDGRKQRKKLERMCSEDRASSCDRGKIEKRSMKRWRKDESALLIFNIQDEKNNNKTDKVYPKLFVNRHKMLYFSPHSSHTFIITHLRACLFPFITPCLPFVFCLQGTILVIGSLRKIYSVFRQPPPPCRREYGTETRSS